MIRDLWCLKIIAYFPVVYPFLFAWIVESLSGVVPVKTLAGLGVVSWVKVKAMFTCTSKKCLLKFSNAHGRISCWFFLPFNEVVFLAKWKLPVLPNRGSEAELAMTCCSCSVFFLASSMINVQGSRAWTLQSSSGLRIFRTSSSDGYLPRSLV